MRGQTSEGAHSVAVVCEGRWRESLFRSGLPRSHNEFRRAPLHHRGLRQISEGSVHLDLFTSGSPLTSHDGEHLHRSHAAAPVPRGPRGPLSSHREGKGPLWPLGLVLRVYQRVIVEEPDRARPVRARMGLQPGHLPKHDRDRGTLQVGSRTLRILPESPPANRWRL